MNKKVVFWALLLSLSLGGLVSAQGLEGRLQQFVLEIYQNYAAQDFQKVYQVMHPGVKELVTEEDYTAFQQHHFKRLRLRLDELAVGDVEADPRLPSALRVLVPEDEDGRIFGVELSYKAHFVSGIRFSQSITKQVYLVMAADDGGAGQLYLLWDPRAMEEEQDNEGD